jgi:hypothetical protein
MSPLIFYLQSLIFSKLPGLLRGLKFPDQNFVFVSHFSFAVHVLPHVNYHSVLISMINVLGF